MIQSQELLRLLSHLQNYGQGDRLKRNAMIEVETTLGEAGLSRRNFLRKAKQLGIQGTTVTSLGNWISCKHMPNIENVAFLVEALETVLKEHHSKPSPILIDQLQSSSIRHHQELDHLRQQVQDVDFATVMLQDTLTWINLSEFPLPHSSLTSTFIPITRQHGIQRLTILREVHSQALDNTLFPQNVPHALIMATASIIMAHYLLEVGHSQLALETADEGVYILEDTLKRLPKLRAEPMIGYTFRNWSQLEVLGLLYKSNVYKSMARQASQAVERSKYIDLASATLRSATAKVEELPLDPGKHESGLLRDTAELLLEFEANKADEAERLAQQVARCHENLNYPDDPLLYYLGRATQAKALILQSKLGDAETLLRDAQDTALFAVQHNKVIPGPIHRLEYLRAERLLYYTKAQATARQSTERLKYKSIWKEKVVESQQIAQATGLVEEQQRLLNEILQVEYDFRQLVLADLRSNPTV